MRVWRLAISIALSITFASSAKAATLWETNYGAWYLGAYSDDKTGAFTHCAASAAYNSGTILTFGLGTGGWTIGVGNPTWQLPVRSSFPVALQVDQNQPISVKTYVTNPTFAGAPLEASAYLFQLFRRGRLLKIQTARGMMRFDLAGSARVLDVILSCASSRMKSQSATVETNPFSDQSTPTETSAAISDHTAETTAYLANVLSAAGIQGFSLSPSPKSRPWEVAWTAPSIVGLARIDEKSTVDESAIIIAAGDSGICKGSFASTRQPTSDGKVLLLKTACKTSPPAQSFQYSYFIVPRAAGGSFITGLSETAIDTPAGSATPEVGPRLLEASHSYFETSQPAR